MRRSSALSSIDPAGTPTGQTIVSSILLEATTCKSVRVLFVVRAAVTACGSTVSACADPSKGTKIVRFIGCASFITLSAICFRAPLDQHLADFAARRGRRFGSIAQAEQQLGEAFAAQPGA